MVEGLFEFLQRCVLLTLAVSLVTAIAAMSILLVAIARDVWRS